MNLGYQFNLQGSGYPLLDLPVGIPWIQGGKVQKRHRDIDDNPTSTNQLSHPSVSSVSNTPEQQEEREERQPEHLEHEFHDESEAGHGHPV
jgi:hypothetical protein